MDRYDELHEKLVKADAKLIFVMSPNHSEDMLECWCVNGRSIIIQKWDDVGRYYISESIDKVFGKTEKSDND